MALSQAARSLNRIHFRDTLSRGSLASASSDIHSRRSGSRAIPSSSYHQLTTPHRPLLQRRVPSLQHPVLRSELAFSVSWTRGYALKYDDDLRPITSVDDVQAIFAEVGSLEKEAAGLGRFIFGPRNMDMTEYTMRLVSGSVAKAYGCLKDLSSSVHDALRLGSGGKTGPEDQPSYHAKLTVDAFEKAIADTENGSGAMFELQETYAEFSGKIATLQNKLSRAKGYLEAQLEWHRQLAKETGEAAQIAAQGALEAEIKVAQLEDKLLAQIRFEEDSVWWSWALPGIAIGSSLYIEKVLEAGRALLESFQHEREALMKRAKKQATKGNEVIRTGIALTHMSAVLGKRNSGVDQLRNNQSRMTELVVKTKENLLGIQNRHLADVKALLDISFDTANMPSLCESILRIVLAAPALSASNYDKKSLNSSLQETCKTMSDLPDSILAEAPVDEDDWGSEAVSLKDLLKEAKAFTDGRGA